MKEKKAMRKPTTAEAYGTILFMLVVIGVGNGYFKLDLKMMLIVCTAFNMVMAWRCHASWDDMQRGIVAKITSMGGCFLILLGIGFLIGTCMLSGTMPLLVSWLARLIAPKYCMILSFLLVGVLSLAIGSSFAAMGTLGVVMFSVATVQNLPLGMAAAAVICGAWVGQYISPVADVVNCAAIMNKITPYQYMRDMVAPVAIASGLTAVFFFVMGLRYNAVSPEALSGVNSFIQDVNANFNTNPIILIPLLIAIVLSILRIPTVIVLFGSGFAAIILAVLVQGYDFAAVIGGAYSGYSSDVFLAGREISGALASLVNRGGIFSMADPVVFLLCALSCVGMLDVIGVFDVVQKTIFRDTKSPGRLTLISMFGILTLGLVTADPYPPVIVGADLLRDPFVRAGYQPRKAAIISQGGGLLMTMCLPWSFCAWYSGNVYGVTLGQYFPYAILFPLVPIIIVVMSFMGFGNVKLPEDYAPAEAA